MVRSSGRQFDHAQVRSESESTGLPGSKPDPNPDADTHSSRDADPHAEPDSNSHALPGRRLFELGKNRCASTDLSSYTVSVSFGPNCTITYP